MKTRNKVYLATGIGMVGATALALSLMRTPDIEVKSKNGITTVIDNRGVFVGNETALAKTQKIVYEGSGGNISRVAIYYPEHLGMHFGPAAYQKGSVINFVKGRAKFTCEVKSDQQVCQIGRQEKVGRAWQEAYTHLLRSSMLRSLRKRN
jgi:hypothetical protein